MLEEGGGAGGRRSRRRHGVDRRLSAEAGDPQPRPERPSGDAAGRARGRGHLGGKEGSRGCRQRRRGGHEPGSQGEGLPSLLPHTGRGNRPRAAAGASHRRPARWFGRDLQHAGRGDHRHARVPRATRILLAVAGGRSILLVEDHAESRASLAYVLEKRGEVVHQASNGRSALTVARRERLHALILDLKLPDMDGLSVLEAGLAEAPGLPALVVAGFGTIAPAVGAMERGAAEFLY